MIPSDRDILLDAVIANVVGGLSTNDRESLLVMAPIEDAAQRVGVDLPGLFEDASAVVGRPGTLNQVTWLSRKPENRTLETMRFVAEERADGLVRADDRWVVANAAVKMTSASLSLNPALARLPR